MASASIASENPFIFDDIHFFPTIQNGKINVNEFMTATTDLITLVDRLGKMFSPVKYDMQGNIDKIKKYFDYDEESCLLLLMLNEKSNGKFIATEGVLWLNRALLFFEIAFQEILASVQANNYNACMKKIFTVAYEGSVKKYHSWVTQQLFVLICKMSPTLPQILKSFGAENNLDEFKTILENFHSTLHSVRSKIDDFFKEHEMIF